MAINYSAFAPTVSPLQMAMQGVQLGEAMQKNELQNLALQKYNQEADRRLQTQNDLAALSEDLSVSNVQKFMAKNPDFNDKLKPLLDNLTAEQKFNKGQSAFQLFALLDRGDQALAEVELDRQIDAAANSNDTQQEKALRLVKDQLQFNPDAAKTGAYMLAYQVWGPDKLNEALEKTQSMRFAEEEQPLKLAKQTADLYKLGKEIGLDPSDIASVVDKNKNMPSGIVKDILKLNAVNKGLLPPEKRFESEEKLRKEYQKLTGGLIESRRNNDIISISAADGTGQGDVALVTAFMKMLDPSSVVRETEFATARDTTGLYNVLLNRLKKLENGEFLQPDQRKAFKNLANKYLQAAEKYGNKVKDDYQIIVDDYGLTSANVFGGNGQVLEFDSQGNRIK